MGDLPGKDRPRPPAEMCALRSTRDPPGSLLLGERMALFQEFPKNTSGFLSKNSLKNASFVDPP